MKKIKLLLMILLCSSSIFAQEWQVQTLYDQLGQYRKHYSHNIEGGMVDGIQRDFVAGNSNDYGVVNNVIDGQSIEGTNFLQRKSFTIEEKLHFTDFTVHPTNTEYGVGTVFRSRC